MNSQKIFLEAKALKKLNTSNMGKFYVVATPIGNLEDITLRSLRILKETDLILSEKPLKTKRLLDKYNIRTPLKAFFEHSSQKVIASIIQSLSQGQNLALVAEAGTPGIADPGGKLVKEILKKLPCCVKIIPVPGPSALTTLLSIAGFNVNRFLFLGFFPKKNKRKQFLKIVQNSKFPVVVYEAVYRIEKLLQELNELGITELVVGRELTKKFETVYRGSPKQVLAQLKKDKLKGEFTLIINR